MMDDARPRCLQAQGPTSPSLQEQTGTGYVERVGQRLLVPVLIVCRSSAVRACVRWPLGWRPSLARRATVELAGVAALCCCLWGPLQGTLGGSSWSRGGPSWQIHCRCVGAGAEMAVTPGETCSPLSRCVEDGAAGDDAAPGVDAGRAPVGPSDGFPATGRL